MIKLNDVVAMEYMLVDADTKEVVDSNEGHDPLEFIIGMGHIIPGLESQMMGLAKNEKADIYVKADEAYGAYNEEAIQTLPKEQFAGIELKEGMTLYGSGDDGQTVQVAVKSFNDDEVTIDYNHPMAGKNLMFTITVVDVRAATEEELATGVVGGLAHGGGCCGGGSCGSHDHGHDHEEKECCGGEKHGEEHECCGGHDGHGCKNS
ncbi:MAG: peptidylprolyl isomerase [Arcobacteraceae bacterium]|nr:peptidylprolyl isomerase [Arcobacteraceae bacterium]